MKTASRDALNFAAMLNAKFARGENRFSVNPGTKYDKIVSTSYGQRSVHAFVDGAGRVYKAASWAAPAPIVRYPTVQAATDASDVHGRYLYIR